MFLSFLTAVLQPQMPNMIATVVNPNVHGQVAQVQAVSPAPAVPPAQVMPTYMHQVQSSVPVPVHMQTSASTVQELAQTAPPVSATTTTTQTAMPQFVMMIPPQTQQATQSSMPETQIMPQQLTEAIPQNTTSMQNANRQIAAWKTWYQQQQKAAANAYFSATPKANNVARNSVVAARPMPMNRVMPFNANVGHAHVVGDTKHLNKNALQKNTPSNMMK